MARVIYFATQLALSPTAVRLITMCCTRQIADRQHTGQIYHQPLPVSVSRPAAEHFSTVDRRGAALRPPRITITASR